MNLFYSLIAASDISWISAEARDILEPMLMIFMVLLSIASIVIIMMQKANPDNVGAISGETETFMGKHKGGTLESRLKKVTIALLVCLLIVSVFYFIIQSR